MVHLDELKAKAEQVIRQAGPELRDVSLSIHANPELNFEEFHAHATLTAYLERKGFAVEQGAYGMPTAFKAVAGQGGPTIAVLCEYDALPGIGHACGHNLIAISGLAAGLALKETLPAGQGTVVVLGSPAEEGGGGKILLVERGAFDGVAAAMMVHPAPADAAYMNVLAIDHVKVEYSGANAHAAAAPWEGVNALDAMIQAFSAIGLMRQQCLPTDRVHGVITHGGLKPNIIPDYTAAEFYIRSRTRTELAVLREKVEAALQGAGVAARCATTIERPEDQRPYSDMIASDGMAAAYTENMRHFNLRFPTKQQVLSGPGGSTDMGDVSYAVPSIHPMFSIPTAPGAGNHTPGFTASAAMPEAHDATLRAATGLASTGLDLFLKAGFLESVQAEFERSVRGKR
ncbi:MAG: M20 family metallopeptidase [Dehalococcoidia bacterium]